MSASYTSGAIETALPGIAVMMAAQSIDAVGKKDEDDCAHGGQQERHDVEGR